MANIKSAIKRARQNGVRREHNMGLRSRFRTYVKKVIHEVEAKNKEGAAEALRAATSIIDKTANKGLIKKNKAARVKSRLCAKVKALA